MASGNGPDRLAAACPSLLWKCHGSFGPTPAFSPAPENKGVLCRLAVGHSEKQRLAESGNSLVRPEPTRTLAIRDLTSNARRDRTPLFRLTAPVMRCVAHGRTAAPCSGLVAPGLSPAHVILLRKDCSQDRSCTMPAPCKHVGFIARNEATHRRYRKDCRTTGPLPFAETLMEKLSPSMHLPWLAKRCRYIAAISRSFLQALPKFSLLYSLPSTFLRCITVSYTYEY
jgi:hypothetical protein